MVNGDTDLENSESFNLTLLNATGGATLGVQKTAAVTITDDDGTTSSGVSTILPAGLSREAVGSCHRRELMRPTQA